MFRKLFVQLRKYIRQKQKMKKIVSQNLRSLSSKQMQKYKQNLNIYQLNRISQITNYDEQISHLQPNIVHKKNRANKRNSINYEDQFNQENYQTQLKPIKLLRQDIKRRLSRNNILKNESQLKLDIQSKNRLQLPPLMFVGQKMLKKKRSRNKIEIRLGMQKINQSIELIFSSIFKFPQQKINNSYLYYLDISAGIIHAKSSLSLLQTLNQSQIKIRYNKGIVKNCITFTFYKVIIPESFKQRLKIGYFNLDLPAETSVMRNNDRLSVSATLWNELNQPIQQIKLYIQLKAQ